MFALIFDSVGAGEWVVLLAVLLIVMGPKRLPSTLRTFGSYYAKFRRAAESFKRQLLEMDTEIQREVAKVEQEVEEATRLSLAYNAAVIVPEGVRAIHWPVAA